jgi:hypothetical protein
MHNFAHPLAIIVIVIVLVAALKVIAGEGK